MPEYSNQNSPYSAYAGQRGFWAKRSQNAEPEFISVATGDIESVKQQWAKQSGVDWVGDSPNDFYTNYQPGSKNTAKGTDVVEDTYFDVMLKDIQGEYGAQRQSVESGYETFLKQVKQDRELFNVSLEKDYGKALESLNISTQNRGVQGAGGIQGRQTTDITKEKDLNVERQNILESQKKYLASEQRQESLDSIARAETRSRSRATSAYSNSPYAEYNII